MITAIIGIAGLGYLGIMFGIIGIGLIIDIVTGDWELLRKDFGYLVYINGGLGIGLAIGMFTILNLLNWRTEGYFAINMFDPNKWGFIFLTFGIIFLFVGKAIMRDRKAEKIQKEFEEQKKHKYVTLKSGKRVRID